MGGIPLLVEDVILLVEGIPLLVGDVILLVEGIPLLLGGYSTPPPLGGVIPLLVTDVL